MSLLYSKVVQKKPFTTTYKANVLLDLYGNIY